MPSDSGSDDKQGARSTVTVEWPSPKHERVHDLLSRLVSVGAAQFFADACEISQRRPPYPTATHLVGHLIREVESATRDRLLLHPDAQAALTQDKAAGKKSKSKGSKCEQSPTHVNEIRAIIAALSLQGNLVAARWSTFTGRNDSWAKDAHRDDLQPPRGIDDGFVERLTSFVDILLVVLDAAEANYAAVVKSLSDLKDKASPAPGEAERMAIHVAPGVTPLSHVIFASLTDRWLVPLREGRAFCQPPGPTTHADGGVSFPSWPQAFYLERIAESAPDEVLATIRSVPATDNENIHRAFLSAAAKCPPAIAAAIAAHEVPWLSNSRWLTGLLPNAVQELATCLVAGGQFDAAAALLRCAIVLDPSESDWSAPQPRSGISDWSYDRLLREPLKALTVATPVAARSLLVEALANAQLQRSSLWRSAIEDHEQNRMLGPLDCLVVSLRDLYEAEISSGRMTLVSAVSELETHEAPIFRRLALHLLRVFGADSPELVTVRASTPSLLDSAEEFHELSAMIAARFADLAPGQQLRVIRAMRENASLDHVVNELGDGEVSRERSARAADAKRIMWFSLLGHSRPQEIEDEYQQLCVVAGGEPQHPTFHGWIGRVQTGPNPPMTAAQLQELPDQQLLTYLQTWTPNSTDVFEPSREGMADAIRKCASVAPARFTTLAREFRVLHPDYAAGLLMGLHGPLQADRSATKDAPVAHLDFGSLLDLLEWIAGPHDGEPYPDAEDWSWPRRMSSSVAEFVASNADADDSHFVRSWRVVAHLLGDPDPSVESGSQSSHHDSIATNSVRGRALQASLRILGASTERASEGRRSVHDAILREIEQRASAETEPVEAVRNVLAQNYNAIFNVSRSSADAISRALFPSVDNMGAARLSSWSSFLRYNHPHRDIFTQLHEQYRLAAAHVGLHPEDAVESLGEHLLFYAGSGVLNTGEEDVALGTFVENAPIKARKAALNQLGRSFHRTTQTLPTDALTRYKSIWERWVAHAMRSNDCADLAAFGWWFASAAFDDIWLLAILPKVLSATKGQLDWDEKVADKLLRLATDYPGEVLSCVESLVDGVENGRMLRCGPVIKRILTLLNTYEATKLGATQLASRLYARGCVAFAELC